MTIIGIKWVYIHMWGRESEREDRRLGGPGHIDTVSGWYQCNIGQLVRFVIYFICLLLRLPLYRSIMSFLFSAVIYLSSRLVLLPWTLSSGGGRSTPVGIDTRIISSLCPVADVRIEGNPIDGSLGSKGNANKIISQLFYDQNILAHYSLTPPES